MRSRHLQHTLPTVFFKPDHTIRKLYTCRLLAEIFDPATETWTLTDSIFVPRNYHSVGVLLQDGRVFNGGSGLCGGCNTNHFDGQIFTPPQLLNNDGSAKARPAITISSPTATNGATLTVTVTANGPLSRIAIIRYDRVLHLVVLSAARTLAWFSAVLCT